MRFYSLLLLLALLCFFRPELSAQASIFGANGIVDGTSYGTLKGAFDAINAQANQSGASIEIRLSASTAEAAAAVLNQPATNTWTSLTIFPTVSGVSISTNVNTCLIQLNGADNVTIDGRVDATGSTADLTIVNTATGTSARTIEFVNTAESNTVQYCIIQGAGTSTTRGTVVFSTATTGLGNSGNTIQYNDITSASDANRPINIIYAAGSVSYENKNNIIQDNNVYDFFVRGSSSNGIQLAANNIGWTISNNSFYETASFAPTASVTYKVINVSVLTSKDIAITGNYIGGSAPLCAGAAWTKTNAFNSTFRGIDLNVGPTVSTTTSVQANTIQNFSWSDSGVSSWTGINTPSTATGAVNIGTVTGNVIGNPAGTITVTAATTAANFYGIRIIGTGIVDCQNNTIESITLGNVATAGTHFYGIQKASAAGNTTISNNIIGSTVTPNSINSTSASTANSQAVFGIYSGGTGAMIINANTVANLTNATTNTTVATSGRIQGIYVIGASSVSVSGNTISDLTIANANTASTSNIPVLGICMAGTTSNKTVADNTIYNLSNTYATFTGMVCGIYYEGGTAGTNTVERNFIHSLRVYDGTASGRPRGIHIESGATSYINNIVSLSSDDATDTGTNAIIGIYDKGSASQTCNLYFNTVYIGGTAAAGTRRSYCFYSANSYNIQNCRNNIFYNARSTAGGTNLHYALRLASNANITINYNDYYVGGTGGALAMMYATVKATLVDWKASTLQDEYSLDVDPGFTPDVVVPTEGEHTPSNSSLIGTSIGGITTDYALSDRDVTNPSIGAYEIVLLMSVEVWQDGVFQTEYPGLRAACVAINAGVHTGALEVKIKNNVYETGAATINASGSGSADYSSIHIYPIVSGLSISGSVNNAFIQLNGADDVTIDGRLDATGSTPDLMIVNTATGTSARTIEFINTAENNTVQYCYIKGGGTSTTRGTIVFSTASAGIGNSGNTIQYNNITSISLAARPINIIYGAGSVSYENRNNTIQNNNIYNFLVRGTASNGIQLAAYNIGWTISNNSFYETASFAPTASRTYKVINVSALTSTDMSITGNYIGGSAPLCSGAAWTKTNAFNSTFMGIDLNVGPTVSTTTSVQGNTIQNFSWSDSGVSNWRAINTPSTATGAVNIGTLTGNVIGSPTGTITVTAATTAANVYGIVIGGTGAVDCQNNTVESITTANASTNATNIYGIIKTATSGSTTISNNTIGSTSTAHSLRASSTATTSGNTQVVIGINSSGTGAMVIDNNTVANLTNETSNTVIGTAGRVQGIYVTGASSVSVSGNTIRNLSIANANTATSSSASVVGISMAGTASNKTLVGNTIYNLSNTYASFAGMVCGIYYQGGTSGTNTVSRNFIYALSTYDGTVSAGMRGISIISGVTTYANNIISIGNNVGNTIYGIYDTGSASQTCNLYFNTVYISGNIDAGNIKKSYCFYSSSSSNTRNYRNNVFYNARSTTDGISLHYAIRLGSNANLTIDYNDYYVSGTGGVLAVMNATDKATLAAWRTSTARDALSYSVNPDFTDAGSVVATDYQIGKDLVGVDGTGITTDYLDGARATIPTMGAWERSLQNRWKGMVDTDWNTEGNWTLNTLPVADANFGFDYDPRNDCTLDADHSVGNISNETDYDLLLNANKLTIKGVITQTGLGKIDASAVGSTIELAGGSAQTIPVDAFLNNNVYNLTLNNALNVTLDGELNILNTMSSASGVMDVVSNSTTVKYAGTTPQTIISSLFAANEVYNLVSDNASGVYQSVDLTVNNDFTINVGKRYIINPARLLTVNGVVTNSAGTSGLVIKAEPDGLLPNGSLIFHNSQVAGQEVPATVEMYTKASKPDGLSYKWQFFGIPLRSVVANPTFAGSYVRIMNELGAPQWTQLSNSSVLTSFAGYEITQLYPKVITFTGNLENKDFTSTTLTYLNPDATVKGQHLIGNPYTAAIDISKIVFTDMVETVYLFNTGSVADWVSAGYGSPDINENITAGKYISIPKNIASRGTGIPSQIPSMQAFIVQANATGTPTLSIPYSAVGTVVKNTTLMRAPAALHPSTRIDVKGNAFGDRMWLFTEPGTTRGFDNGWDGEKWMSNSDSPQLFAMEVSGNYQVNTVPDVNNTDLGFQAGMDNAYTMTFTHENLETQYPVLYLLDLQNNNVTDITASGTQYSFTATNTVVPEKRFRIMTDLSGTTANIELNEGIQLFSFNKTIFVNNTNKEKASFKLYDSFGRMVYSSKISATSNDQLTLDLPAGVYIANISTSKKNLTQKVLLK